MNLLNKLTYKFVIACFSIVITAFATQPAMADDLNLYQAIFNAEDSLGNGETDPNILFIMDTSGSMKGFRIIEKSREPNPNEPLGDYDPEVDYGDNGRDNNYYFYHARRGNGQSYLLSHLRGHQNRPYTYFITKVKSNQNVCQASKDYFESNPLTPHFRDQFTQWHPRNFGWGFSSWAWKERRDDITFRDNDNVKVDCQDDYGKHGLNNSGDKYPLVCFDNNGNSAYCNVGNNIEPQYQDSKPRARVCVRQRYSYYYRRYICVEYGYEDVDNPYQNMAFGVLITGNYHQYLLKKAEEDSTGGSTTNTVSSDDCSSNGQLLTQTTEDGEIITYECLRKIDIMKKALKRLVEGDPDDDNVNPLNNANIGLMRFNPAVKVYYNNGYNYYYNVTSGSVIDAISPVGQGNNREDFSSKVDGLPADASTPLAETYYEAYQYFTGGESVGSRSSLLDSAAVENGIFKSPIGTSQCQANYIVYLSDGLPSGDNEYDGKAEAIPGIAGNNNNNCGTYASENGDAKNCLPAMSKVLKWKYGVRTFTIAFAVDIPVLKDAAENGYDEYNSDGTKQPRDTTSALTDADLGYYVADDLDTLNNAFANIISQIQSVERDSFVAPAVTVNAFNRLQSKEDIYYALFKPSREPRWTGNLKKYKVSADGKILDSSNPPKDAIDAQAGYFVDVSKSFWSNEVDGNVVPKGGMAGELSTNRKLFASLEADNEVDYLGASSDTETDGPVNMANALKALDSTGAILGIDTELSGNFATTTATITDFTEPYKTLLEDDTTTDEQLDNFLNIARWSLGEVIGTGSIRANQYVAESVHSTPVVISYGTETGKSKDIIFLATNQGMLHAVAGQEQNDGGFAGKNGGSELWAYVPDRSLLSNLGGYFNNKRTLNGVQRSHIYGLDGIITADTDRDVRTNELTLAKLYFGMRRGGNKYFAVDVLNADVGDPSASKKPVEKLWTIEGGQGDYKRIGQTWAKPIVTKIKICSGGESEGCYKKVVIVAGGYDTKYDDVKPLSDLEDKDASPTLGNAIYILDADNGKVLGVATNKSSSSHIGSLASSKAFVVSDMKHSIVSAPTVIDSNNDGAIDAIFAVDMAGQVFRFDLSVKDDESKGIVATGGRIADLRVEGEDRRFYNPLDVTYLPKIERVNTDTGEKDVIPERYALVTGSGFRSKPLADETYGNRYYVLYDRNVSSPPTNYTYVEDEVIDESDLTELKTAYNSDVADRLDPFDPDFEFGYYMKLKNQTAEKALNPTLIADYQVIAVTYTPASAINDSNQCSSAAGRSYAYRFDLRTGETARISLSKPGISAAPVVLYIFDDSDGKEKVKPVVVIGTEPFEGEEFKLSSPDVGKARKKGWWEMHRRN